MLLFFYYKMEMILVFISSCSYSLIYAQFCGTDSNSKDNSVGLQLLGIILANNLPAYDASCGIEYER